jgi:hypothetical protein
VNTGTNTAVTISSLGITPATASVMAGTSVTLVGSAVGTDGKPFAIAMTYSNSNSSVGAINATSGVLDTFAAGITTVTVAAGGKTASATITVTANPNLHSFYVTIQGTSESDVGVCVGQRLIGDSVTWTRTTYNMYSPSYLWNSTTTYMDSSTHILHVEVLCVSQSVTVVLYKDGTPVLNQVVPANTIWWVNTN